MPIELSLKALRLSVQSVSLIAMLIELEPLLLV